MRDSKGDAYVSNSDVHCVVSMIALLEDALSIDMQHLFVAPGS